MHLVLLQWSDNPFEGVTVSREDMWASFALEKASKCSVSSVASDKSPRVLDILEPINIEGQEETGIWIHQPGTEVSQIWEPRKGRSRCLDSQVPGVPHDASAGSNESSSPDETQEGKNTVRSVGRGLKKVGLVFRRNGKNEESGNMRRMSGLLGLI